MNILLRDTSWISDDLYMRTYVTEEVVPKIYTTPKLAVEAAKRTIEKYNALFRNSSNYGFLMSIVWQQDRNPMLDVLAFQRVKPEHWNDNLDISKFYFENGEYSLNPSVTCENGILIASREIKMRRTCATLDEFVGAHPDLTDLGLKPKKESFLLR